MERFDFSGSGYQLNIISKYEIIPAQGYRKLDCSIHTPKPIESGIRLNWYSFNILSQVSGGSVAPILPKIINMN